MFSLVDVMLAMFALSGTDFSGARPLSEENNHEQTLRIRLWSGKDELYFRLPIPTENLAKMA